MFAAERDVFRVLFSMAQLEPGSVGGTVDKMARDRAGGMEHLARHLDDAGLLRPGISVEDATHMLWVITSFESFDLLYTTRGLALDQTIDLLVAMAERSLYR